MQHRSENFKIACQNHNKENMKIELHSIISEASEDEYSVKDSDEKLITKCEFPDEEITGYYIFYFLLCYYRISFPADSTDQI